MVPAAARNGGPRQDRVDPLRLREPGRVEQRAAAIVKRPVAPPFAVPEHQLPVEVPKARDCLQLDPLGARGVAHAEECGHGLVVQRAARRVQFDDVGAGATRQFQRVHAVGVPGIEVGYDAAQAVEPHTK